LIKSSKGKDSSEIFTENFSEILWRSSWALGKVTWVKITQKLLHLWHQSRTISNPQPKIFF